MVYCDEEESFLVEQLRKPSLKGERAPNRLRKDRGYSSFIDAKVFKKPGSWWLRENAEKMACLRVLRENGC